MNWRDARDLLDGKGKRRGPQDSLKIARNTVLERNRSFSPQGPSGLYRSNAMSRDYPSTAIGLRFHDTYVAILTPRWTELNTGGWPTMSTADRIRYVEGLDVRAHGKGWSVFLTDELPCYCASENARLNSDGIVIRGDYAPGMALKFQNAYEGESDVNPNGKPVYAWAPCQSCKGTTIRTGIDWDSGGHPFYDGIRVSADGRRLMRTQPHKPKVVRQVKTESGFEMSGIRWTGY